MKTFPIMHGGDIKAVPWYLAEGARAQAERNHDQTLERLAERGGLSPQEFIGAYNSENIRTLLERSEVDAVAQLRTLLRRRV
jgi:hypothetical protein